MGSQQWCGRAPITFKRVSSSWRTTNRLSSSQNRLSNGLTLAGDQKSSERCLPNCAADGELVMKMVKTAWLALVFSAGCVTDVSINQTPQCDGIQQPGEHVVRWNMEGLPAGVYIYRLVAGDEVVSGKIVKR